MKKQSIQVIAFLVIVLFVTPAVLAVTASPSASIAPSQSGPSATVKPTGVQAKIDDLKERLATKVAELRKTSAKAIFGIVNNVTVSTVTIDLGGKAIKIELTDDIKVAQMLKGKRTALTIDKVAKSDAVTIFGEYDSTLDLLRAKQIFIEDSKFPIRITGTIASVDKTNFAFTVKTGEGQTYTVDVETTTKSNIWQKGGTIEKAGFSKITEGSLVTVLGIEDPKKPNFLSASRILLLSLTAKAPTPTEEVTPTPSKKATTTVAPTKTQ